MIRDEEEIRKLADALRPVFARHDGIIAAYLFGSHATAEETPASDIDLGIIYSRQPALMDELALEVEICAVLDTEHLDLVDLNKARIELQFQAVYTGKPIYCSDETARADFVEMVLDRNGDYGALMRMLARDFVAGLKEDYGHA